jgi:hypothetical protein
MALDFLSLDSEFSNVVFLRKHFDRRSCCKLVQNAIASSSYPIRADADSCPGNCAGMEEATEAPSSFTDYLPRRLRASSRDGDSVMTRPPSPLQCSKAPCAQQSAMPAIGFMSGRSPFEREWLRRRTERRH